METQQKNKIRGWEAEEKQENTKQQQQQQQQSKESVSSAPSSPSHEFSFTISLLSCSSSSTTTTNNKAKSQQQQPPLAIDLTPADDIFFHGHLLPLHLLQNLPSSPRSSTNSLPIRELLAGEVKPHNIHSCICSNCTDTRPKRHSFNSYEYNTRRSYYDHTNMNDDDEEEKEFPAKERVKSKSFSLFGRPRRRKQGDSRCEDQNKKKVRFDHVSHFLRKYIALFSKGRIRTEDIQFTKQPFSFSGKLKLTSPANRGVLVAASRVPPPPSSDSTMEELQAAIQAAIAHCKNSIAVAEKLNS